MPVASANFGFLEKRNRQLFRLAALAEEYFHSDPNATLFKLRLFAELLAKEAAARTGECAPLLRGACAAGEGQRRA